MYFLTAFPRSGCLSLGEGWGAVGATTDIKAQVLSI